MYYYTIESKYIYTYGVCHGVEYHMTRARLYIADMDLAFVSRVRGALASCAGIEIIGSAGNGRRALQDIVRLAPDVLLTDIPLPEMDGFTLLREVKRLRLPPQVIVCTRFYSEVSMQCACKYGAAFFLCKPIDPETLPGLILECGKCAADPQPSNISPLNTEESMRGVVAKDLLRQLGLSPRLNGSVYLLETMLHLHGDSLLFKNLSHGLYAELARRMGTTVPRVERSLRNAINIAYERGTLSKVFPCRPTNKEFIEYVMREIDRAVEANGHPV